jgi:hypothetical protein
MSTLELENIKHPDNSGDNIALASNGSITIDRKSTDGTIAEFRKDGTTVGSIGVNNSLTYITTDGGFGVGSGITFDSSGVLPTTRVGGVIDNVFNLGSSSTRFKDAYLSGGVYLGGTSSANKLDDYEEGTWTPIMTGATFSTNYTCRYTKIGNLVNLDLAVEMNAIGNTHLQISGLPFTSISGVWGGDIWTNGWSSEPGHVRYWAGNTTIAFYQSNGSGGVNAINQSMIGGNSGNIFGIITYMTNS